MARQYYLPELKKRAQLLRAEGISFKDVGKKLGVAKSTARLWTKDIKLSAVIKKKLYTNGILKIIASPNNARNRRLREIEAIKKSADEEIVLPISGSGMKLIGAMLYWAEGNKTRNFGIANSDPLLIAFFVRWLETTFSIPPTQIKAHLNIYSQQNELHLKKFWAELTSIPISNFGKTFVKPLNKNYKQNTLYYGTIKLRVFRGSDFRHRLFGWIEKLLTDINVDVSKIETRWNKLKTDYPRI